MFYSSPRRRRVLTLLALLILGVVAFVLLRSPLVTQAAQVDPITAAWNQARASGSYHFETDVTQITIPSAKISNVGRSSRVEELRLEGKTNLEQRSLELQLWSQNGSVAQQQSALHVKVENGKTYTRNEGNEWKVSQDLSLDGLAPEADFMGYLRAIRNVQAHAPESRAGIHFTRYSFTIDGPTYALYMHDKIEAAMRAKGELPPDAHMEVPRYYRDMVGEGELWISDDGLPLRQILTLQFPEQNDQTIHDQLKISFSKFGEESTVNRQGSGVRSLSQLTSDLGLLTHDLGFLFILLPMLAAVAVVLRYHRVRKLQNAIAIAVIVSFIVGPILKTISDVSFLDAQAAKAATQKEQQQQVDAQQSLQEAMDQAPFNPHEDPVAAAERNALANAQQAATVNGSMAVSALQASAVITTDNGIDTDGDGLSDFVEQRVGTDYTYADSDEDKIPDGVEVKGFTLAGKTWYANALEADSNNDGIADTIERDANGDNIVDDTDGDGTPDLFDNDNDNDGVADNKDLAPFSATSSTALFNEANPLKLTVKNLTAGKTTFVDFQIRPKDAKHLWFAFNVLDWPNDSEGQVRDMDGKTYADLGSTASPNEANGDMKLVPMLELRIPTASANLPPTSDLTPYNITVNNYNSNGSTKSVYVPLSVVTNEKTGERVAFSGRMRYLPTGVWTLAHEVRLAWVVQGLVDMPCDHTNAQDVAQGCAEDDYIHNVGQVIQSYYDDFSVTGLNISEDNGTSMAIAYDDPAADSNVLDDAPLTALAAGLDSAFLAARDKDNNGVRDVDINELVRRFNRTSNSGVSETLRWAIPNTLRVEKIDYATNDQAVIFTAMTETKRILNANFTSPWQSNPTLKPLLLYAQEQRSRSLGLDGIKTSGGYVTQSGSDLVFDLAPTGQAKTSLDVMTSVKWTPYCAPAGGAPSWDACAADVYWDDLEQRYGATPLAGDPTNDSDIPAGRTGAMQLFAITLMSGISRVVQRDNQLVSSLYTLKSDSENEGLVRTALSIGNTAVKAIANKIIMARYVDQTSIVKYLGNQLKSLRATLFGEGAILRPALDILRSFRSGGHLNRLAGTGIVAGVAVVIGGLLTGAYFLAQAYLSSDPTANLAAKITIKVLVIGISTFFSVVSPIKTAVEWAGAVKAAGAGTSILKAGSQVIGSTQKAGAIGTVIAVAVTWGFFLYSMIANKVTAFSAEFNKALAETIATTIYYVLLFAISVTVIGTIIAGIVAIIDAILTAICELGVDALRTVPGLGGACFTLGNGAIKVLSYLIYNYDQMIDTDRNDLVVMGSPKVSLADPNKGFIQGNGISVSMPVTTTAVHKSPNPSNGLIINVYLWLFSPDNLRSTTFKYSLSQTESSFVVDRDQMTSAWQNVGVDHYYVATPMYRGQAPASPVPQVTGIVRTAGLNRTADFYFNTSYALPAYECWMMPFPFIPFVPPIPICYTRTLAGSNSTKIDAMKYDIFPATLDGFMTMGTKTDGGQGMAWDAAFPSLRDVDGDGLLALNRGGIDPNDTTWDADSDGLADSFELERRQAGVNFSTASRDTDNDGLTDLQEAQIGSNPAKADTDADGLKDSDEVWHERINTATGAGTGIWEGGWDITINATSPFVLRVSSDPTLKDTDRDGLDDLAERALALDPVAANRLDLDNRPYSPIIVNSPPLVISGEVNDADRFLAPNQSFILTSTVVALRPLNPGTLNLTVPSVLGVPSPASPYALAFNPLTFNKAQTVTLQTNLKVIANPTSQVANIGSRVQATLNPSNGAVSATSNYTVTVDNDKPSVILTSLPNGGYVRAFNRTFYVIGGTAADATSYPTLVRVTAQDGIGTRDATGAASWSAAVGINPGTNLIKLYTRDAVGNEYTTPTDITIYGDGLPPSGVISSIDGNYTTTRNSAGQWVVKINGTISDPKTDSSGSPYPASGVDPASLRMQLNPFDFNPGQSLEVGSWQPVTYKTNDGSWSVDYVLPSDVTDLPPSAFYGTLLTASDRVGNTNTSASLRIRVDARPPLATLTSTDLSRGALDTIISRTVSLAGTVLDPLIGTGIDDINFQPKDSMDVSFAPITSVLPYSGTVLQLNFEDRMGSATLADSSGQSNRASCTGRCPQVGVVGRTGNGLQSAANSASLLVKDSPVLNFPQFPATGSAQSFSAQGWVKLGAETSTGLIVLEKIGNHGGYSLGIADGIGRAYWKVTKGTFTTDAVTITGNRDLRDGQWHHLVGVYDRQMQLSTLYVDGVAIGSATALNGDYSSPLDRTSLAAAYSTYGRVATFDQITLWNHALTVADIQALYRTADKVWYPATVTPRVFVGDRATWSLPVPNTLEGIYQIDGQSTDIFGNRGANNNLWRGIIDQVAPRVTISGTATGQSVLDANNVRQYEVKYSCVARDWQLDESKFNCPGNASQPASRGFNTDPILQSQFPTLTILSTLTNTWTVWQPSNIPNGSLTACDATGKCSTATLGSAVAASGKLQVAGENLATGETFSVATAEVAAIPSEQPVAHIVYPTDGSFVGSAGIVEVGVSAEAAKGLKEVTLLLDGELVATLPFARIDQVKTAQESVELNVTSGQHQLEARASDWTGAAQAVAAPIHFILLAKEPTVALVKTHLTLSDTYQAQSGIVLIQGTVDNLENLAAVQVKVGDQPYADALVKDGVWGIAYPVTDPEDQSLKISVRAIDKAGQITKIGEEADANFDSGIVPETSITAQPNDSVNATIGFTGTVGNQAAAAFECKLDEDAFTPCTPPVEYKDLSNGAHSFQVHAINGQGTQDSTPAEVKWTVNAGGTQATITKAPSNPATSRTARLEFSGGGEYECSLDDSAFAACASPVSYYQLSDGIHSFQVRVKGNPASKVVWKVTNVAPVASSMVVTTAQNANLPLTLKASDEDTMTYHIVNAPIFGVLQGSAPNLVYQPGTDSFGTDSFSFKADDGDATSNLATVTVNVTPQAGQGGLQRDGFVVFGSEGVILRENVKVMSGDVAASNSSQGPWLGDGAEVSIGNGVTFADVKSKVMGDTLFVGQGTALANANYNELRGPGSVSGNKVTPQALPLLNRFVAMPGIGVGKQNIDVASASTSSANVSANVSANSSASGSVTVAELVEVTVAPGNYLSLNVAKGGEVTFSGGVYSFKQWNVAENTKLYFAAATEIRISGQVLVGEHGYVGPTPNSAVTAKQIVIYVAGTNATTGVLGGLGAKAATFGPYATLAANVVVPNGTLLIRERSKAVGSFVGRWVSVGKFSELTLANRFNSSPVEGRVDGYVNLTLDDVSGINSTAVLSPNVNDELLSEEGSNEDNPDAVRKVFLPVISSGTVGQSDSKTVDSKTVESNPVDTNPVNSVPESSTPNGEEQTNKLFLPTVSR